MNKKIGMLTFHYAENYGAFLQAYALQNWLNKKTEYDIEIIDYRANFLIEPYKISPVANIKKATGIKQKLFAIVDFMVELPNRVKKRINYKKARKNFKLSSNKYYSDNFNLSNDYKALILGSDQIWNPEITHGLDKAYFGAVSADNCKVISYAASCGISNYENKYESELKALLKGVNCIGVREQQSVDLLSKYTDKNITVNVDPTLLAGREFWKEQVKPVKESNYIFVYMLANNYRIMDDAKRLSEETGKKVIHFRSPSIRKVGNFNSASFSGPFEFISYINSADIVLTDSFHATCFSLIFKKNFYSYLGQKRSERLISLAQMGKFEDRLVNYGDCISTPTDVTDDYYFNLNKNIKESEDYLIKNIG